MKTDWSHAVVLIVDNEERYIKEVSAMIEARKPLEIITAQGGQEGIIAISERHEDIGLIVTDFNMPSANGLTLIQYALGKEYDGPIVIMTSEPDDPIKANSEAKIKDLPALIENVRVLKKGFKLEDLEIAIDSIAKSDESAPAPLKEPPHP